MSYASLSPWSEPSCLWFTRGATQRGPERTLPAHDGVSPKDPARQKPMPTPPKPDPKNAGCGFLPGTRDRTRDQVAPRRGPTAQSNEPIPDRHGIPQVDGRMRWPGGAADFKHGESLFAHVFVVDTTMMPAASQYIQIMHMMKCGIAPVVRVYAVMLYESPQCILRRLGRRKSSQR